jgi:PAS domain S-box-containing protein
MTTATGDSIPVLHVEDDADFGELAAEFLERADAQFAVETATSVDQGLTRLGEREFECVISDYEMPGRDGLTFLETVREEYEELPFVLFTGKGSEEIASEALARGATDYLQKEAGTDQYELLANRVRNAVEQYRTRREIERREHRFHALLEQSTDRLSIVDEEGRYQFVSPAMEHLMGHEPEALLGESGFEYVHPDDRERVREAFENVVENPDEIPTVEYRFQHRDGSWRWVETRAKNRLDDPALEGIVLNSRDINGWKERERTRSRFRALTENTGLGVVTIDDDSTIHYANEAVEELFGYAVDELVGESLLTLMPDRFQDAHEDGVARYLRDGIRRLDWNWIELPGRHANGEEVPLGFSFGETTIEGDHRFTAIIRDVSERRRRKARRETTIEVLRALYDVTTDPDLGFEDKTGLLLELGCEKLGFDYGFLTRIDRDDDGTAIQEIVAAHGDHELIQPGESCPLSEAYCRETIDADGLLAIADAAEAGWKGDPAHDRFGLESYIGGKVLVDGETYGTLCFASPTARTEAFTDTERAIVRLTSRWTSYELERRRMTAELERQNDRLKEFASILAHDLRNPLNVATGEVDLAREEHGSNRLDRVAANLDRMEALIDDVLALARDGETVTETEPVDLGATVERGWRNVATADGTLAVETNARIYADGSRLQQLLENLLGNAIEHVGEEVTVTVADLDDGFYVEDDGPGIPDAERDDVFESGYTTSGEGTGFGLAIVREIAGAHDWTVAVTDGETGGARFEITGVESVSSR